MTKTDITKWKEVRVGDLFDIHPTKAYKLTNSNLLDWWDFPVVVNSSFNNWIWWFTSNKPTEQWNMITFSDTVDANTIFYQENNFVWYAHVQWLYPKSPYQIKRTKNCLLFFCSCFRKSALTKGFDYWNKFRRAIAIELKIKLPATETWEPDREYMENYMKDIEIKVKKKLQELKKERENKKINLQEWKDFHLYDEYLFDIDSGSKLDKSKMETDNPKINFVWRANANNWITTSVNKIHNINPYQAWYLTLSLWWEYLGSCFIQPKDFYTSQNVVVLKPKRDMPFYVKQFIANIIFKEWRTHYKAFSDELNRHIKTDFKIKLPVISTWEPDRNYMETYIKNLESKVKNRLSNYIKII